MHFTHWVVALLALGWMLLNVAGGVLVALVGPVPRWLAVLWAVLGVVLAVLCFWQGWPWAQPTG